MQQGCSTPCIHYLLSVAFRKRWEHDLLLQVDVIEDEAVGKRTIRTTTICWGNKLSLLVSTPFYDPRLPANANDPDLDFSQAQIELNTEADWQKVPLQGQHPPAANHQLHLLEPDCCHSIMNPSYTALGLSFSGCAAYILILPQVLLL